MGMKGGKEKRKGKKKEKMVVEREVVEVGMEGGFSKEQEEEGGYVREEEAAMARERVQLQPMSLRSWTTMVESEEGEERGGVLREGDEGYDDDGMEGGFIPENEDMGEGGFIHDDGGRDKNERKGKGMYIEGKGKSKSNGNTKEEDEEEEMLSEDPEDAENEELDWF
ncbi:hypothetical protein BDZ91DRAFT_721654 [Kalaharituber pfeilii]|nr:hypothetical protein BDZ91DRAFT_721654 [Kalaharituber pfeilii]